MEAFLDNASGLIEIAYVLITGFFDSFVIAGNAFLNCITFSVFASAYCPPIIAASISLTLVFGTIKLLLGR